MWAKRLQVWFSRRIFSPKCQKRGRGGRGVWGEFRRARAFRRSEAEAVSRPDWFGKKFGFCSGDTTGLISSSTRGDEFIKISNTEIGKMAQSPQVVVDTVKNY